MPSPSFATPPFAIRLWQPLLLLACILLCAPQTAGINSMPNGLTTKQLDNENQLPLSEETSNAGRHGITPQTNPSASSGGLRERVDAFPAMLDALDVMQKQYFEIWQGIWPTGIDWTSAVFGTHISAALSTLSTSLNYIVTSESPLPPAARANENLINKYFSQLTAFYFGQDFLGLRHEAYDDMLWVTLGWLESIKFIELHSGLHYKEAQTPLEKDTSICSSWHGEQWIPAFAHRARVFWDLASKGWNTSLCDGGMIWNPRLSPYKNAITNELFIAASISMYLYFPGDENLAPFTKSTSPAVKSHDPKYLAAAIEGYRWLNDSHMKNSNGLYTDGFHISGWVPHPINGTQSNTKCDSRNEMVYTYNQGVLLSGHRGLWEATGTRSYLEEGHELVMNVIHATGYDLNYNKPYDDQIEITAGPRLGKWYGLGRSGILEDHCDWEGRCSQDSQTFKGIFFHHLVLFCAPLPPQFTQPGESLDVHMFQELKSWHDESCSRYEGWIRRNAEAAMDTRDGDRKYGAWWGAPFGTFPKLTGPKAVLPKHAVDYINHGIPKDPIWQGRGFEGGHAITDLDRDAEDANDRGRGRTVETQAGGLAVVRALWEIVDKRQT